MNNKPRITVSNDTFDLCHDFIDIFGARNWLAKTTGAWELREDKKIVSIFYGGKEYFPNQAQRWKDNAR